MTGCFYAQGRGQNCGEPIHSGVTNDDDKKTIVDAHNALRRLVAQGKESNGNPGPQPAAANMCEFVSMSLNIGST